MNKDFNLLKSYISLEDFATKNCPKCANRDNCFYEINKRIDGNANCVYFKEQKDE